MSWTESQGQAMFGQYNLTVLEIDQAWLNITNFSSQNLTIYTLSSDCLECPYVRNPKNSYLEPGRYREFIVDTKYPLTYRFETSGNDDIVLENNTQNLHCKVETSMGEFGVYELVIKDESCDISTVLEPVSIYLPFLIPIFFYLGLEIIVFLLKAYKTSIIKFIGIGGLFNKTPVLSTTLSGGEIDRPTKENKSPTKRLRSLDTFRGICIVIMMFVHNGSGGYYFLDHATWDGLHVADLVFPWFLWIMGVCIPVSIKSQVKRNTSNWIIFKRIIIRSLKCIAIGLILNTKGGPVEFRKLRLPGVLQRFGICYFISATSVLLCANDSFVRNQKSENKYLAMIQDVVLIWKGWLITVSAVILHTCLTFLLNVPGCPKGYLGPGGLHKGNSFSADCIGGASGYIDKKILTLDHIYQWPTAMSRYQSSAYDPEGLLGSLTAILTVWLGVQAGLTVQVYQSHKSRILRWAIWAVIIGAIGTALCGGKQTGGLIPLNKNLWSLSFVLTLGSFALILLIILYTTIDVFRIWCGTPFFEPGMNSILLYVAHLVANDILPWNFRFNRMNTHFKMLVEALWGISLWVLWSIYLFRRKFFWTL